MHAPNHGAAQRHQTGRLRARDAERMNGLLDGAEAAAPPPPPKSDDCRTNATLGRCARAARNAHLRADLAARNGGSGFASVQRAMALCDGDEGAANGAAAEDAVAMDAIVQIPDLGAVDQAALGEDKLRWCPRWRSCAWCRDRRACLKYPHHSSLVLQMAQPQSRMSSLMRSRTLPVSVRVSFETNSAIRRVWSVGFSMFRHGLNRRTTRWDNAKRGPPFGRKSRQPELHCLQSQCH
jgi:hypothetical protein